MKNKLLNPEDEGSTLLRNVSKLNYATHFRNKSPNLNLHENPLSDTIIVIGTGRRTQPLVVVSSPHESKFV